MKLRWLQSAMLERFGVVLEGHFDHARANVTHYRARGCQKTGDTHTDTQTHRHTDTQTHRNTDTQTHRLTDGQTIHTETQTHGHIDTQTQ